MKKFWMSRKFWSAVIGLVLIWTAYYVTYFDGIKSEHVMVMFATAISASTLLLMAFIGGTVWKDYIRSVHYKKELDDRSYKNTN